MRNETSVAITFVCLSHPSFSPSLISDPLLPFSAPPNLPQGKLRASLSWPNRERLICGGYLFVITLIIYWATSFTRKKKRRRREKHLNHIEHFLLVTNSAHDEFDDWNEWLKWTFFPPPAVISFFLSSSTLSPNSPVLSHPTPPPCTSHRWMCFPRQRQIGQGWKCHI